MTDQPAVGGSPGHGRRRLGDRIEDAFDQACEQGLLDVASCMLQGLDLALLGRPTSWDRRRHALGLLRAAHNRLERLRNAQDAETPVPAPANIDHRELVLR